MAGFGPVGSMPIASVPLGGSEPAVPASDLPPIGGNPAARTAARIAAEYDHYRNTPLPARAAYAPPSPSEQVVQPLQSVDEDKFFSPSAQLEAANATDEVDATVVRGSRTKHLDRARLRPAIIDGHITRLDGAGRNRKTRQ